MGRPYLYDYDHNPIEPEQFEAVLRDPRRVIGQDRVGAWWVSTVFLGVDYSFGMRPGPILYETMIFGPDGWDGEYIERYRTRETAERGHTQAVNMVKELSAVQPS